jgi:hypothetical protein
VINCVLLTTGADDLATVWATLISNQSDDVGSQAGGAEIP